MTVDISFIKPFVDATRETLATMCNFKAVHGKPFLKKGGPPIEIDIAGIIGLTSSSFSGSITIAFPKAVFLGVLSAMMGETYTEITRENEDGAAELMNIIFGHAKRVLNASGHDIEKALPTIARGKSLQLHSLSKSDVVVMPFEVDAGTFYIEVAIDK